MEMDPFIFLVSPIATLGLLASIAGLYFARKERREDQARRAAEQSRSQ